MLYLTFLHYLHDEFYNHYTSTMENKYCLNPDLTLLLYSTIQFASSTSDQVKEIEETTVHSPNSYEMLPLYSLRIRSCSFDRTFREISNALVISNLLSLFEERRVLLSLSRLARGPISLSFPSSTRPSLFVIFSSSKL